MCIFELCERINTSLSFVEYYNEKNYMIVSFMFMACISFGSSNALLKYDATIEGRKILTLPSEDKPQINGACVFGFRPGKPILYHVAASGAKPPGVYRFGGGLDGLLTRKKKLSRPGITELTVKGLWNCLR